MRKLMWFTLGFGAACALGIYVLPMWLLLLSAVFAAVVGAVLWFAAGSGNRSKAGAVLCLGFLAAALWYLHYDAVRLTPIRAMDTQTGEFTITVTDYSFETDYGITADGLVEIEGTQYKIRFYLHEKVVLSPSDTVTGEFRLRYTGFGATEDPTHHSADGTFLLGYPKGDHAIVHAQGKNWRYSAAYLRQYLLLLIEELFPADAVAFVKALLLGDTSELSYETDTILSLSGIRHVAAVSGLHVSMLFSLVYLLTGKRSVLSAVLGIPVLLLFAAMAGFSASITRACLMQLLMLLSQVLQKEYDPPTALSFAVFTMLLINPVVITSVGFQLSVASVAGIFLFAGRITQWMLDAKRLGRWKKSRLYPLAQKTATSAGVSLGALVLTTPLTAWYFGNVSLVSVLTNLLCLWVVTLLFCGIILACILGAVYLPLGKAVAWVLAWLVRYILGTAGVIASFPLAAVYTESVYITVWLVLCYLLLAVFLLSEKKQTAVLTCCAALSLCVALLASWAEPLLDDYRVTVLDVGQGQCVLLQSSGSTYMVDCGGEYDEGAADKAAAALLSQGVTRLDGMILSHYDRDHVGAAAYLLTRVPTDVLILPQGSGADTWEKDLMALCDGAVLRADKDMVIRWADASITVYASEDTQTSNESSLCVLFHTEKCDILITGDRSTSGELRLMEHTVLPKLDALIVGHHGARTSTGETLLQVTQPQVAVISVGAGNAYEHPAQEVLDRLLQYGCSIRRTDLEGNIVIRG